LGIGFGGGLIALVVGGVIFTVMSAVAVQFWKNPQPNTMPTGFALLILMMGRAAAWAVAAIPAGLGQGIALREKKVILNGVVGGVMGGLVGGLFFDPISVVLGQAERATASRAIGFLIIGLAVGLFVGLVEGWTKTAWLFMKAGPLAGKQFVLFRDTTVLGSSPKAEIYLFKDEAIEPRHALIYNRGGRFEIEDCNTRDGTYVNGIPIRRQILNQGDQVLLGKTVLQFQLKETRP
jgi:Ca-activated chloride channel family protein